ncbi:MAG: hypothetical protein MJE66_00250 [Proteobacteria bacterium]|nr:hypothetical protein [Pseudomonadota bacterium]
MARTWCEDAESGPRVVDRFSVLEDGTMAGVLLVGAIVLAGLAARTASAAPSIALLIAVVGIVFAVGFLLVCGYRHDWSLDLPSRTLVESRRFLAWRQTRVHSLSDFDGICVARTGGVVNGLPVVVYRARLQAASADSEDLELWHSQNGADVRRLAYAVGEACGYPWVEGDEERQGPH